MLALMFRFRGFLAPYRWRLTAGLAALALMVGTRLLEPVGTYLTQAVGLLLVFVSAGQILVIEGGRIVRRGTYPELTPDARRPWRRHGLAGVVGGAS